MPRLAELILQAVDEDRYLFSDHADNQLRERLILHWQVIESLRTAIILRERPSDRPNPIVEFEQTLPDGTAIKSVWAFIRRANHAKLVTVHFFDR